MKQRTWIYFLALSTVVGGAYLLGPATTLTKLVLYNGLGFAAVCAILVGAWRNKPASRRPWLLFAAGQASFLIADIVYYVLEATMETTPFPSLADPFYLSMYPLVIAGLVLMVRQMSPGRDWPSLIDAALIATASFATLGILLMDTYITDPNLDLAGRLISLAYPVMDVALLAVAARLAAGVHLRHPSIALMSASLASLLVADVVYGILQSAGTFQTGGIVDAFWLGFYCLFGAAALHPTMARPPVPSTNEPGRLTSPRLMVLCLATLTVPVMDLALGTPIDKILTTTASAAMFLLVLGRVLGLTRTVQASEARLRHAAAHDALTGLANRSLFAERVEHALAKHPDGVVTVLFVDLDDFKTVNDSLGHQAGDDLLRVVAERLRSCVRDEDTVARLGGDEFAVLLESAVDREDAIAVARRALSYLDEPVTLQHRQVRISASLGIAVEARGSGRVESLLRGADVAMYLAKGKGKGRFEFFEKTMYEEAVERLELTADLRNALNSDELEIYYQPILDFETTEVVSVEALLRWNHPTRGIVAPTRFIRLAEESGMIVPIGRWVLEQACAQVKTWQGEYPAASQLGVSVNLSARQLHDPRLLEDVAEALRHSGLNPNCLTLELTESMLIDDAERGSRALEQLKALKVKVAIDDFLTGYSSLGYLRRFPVDTIKIDKSFIFELHHSKTSEALVRTVIDLATSLSMSTVAEGIEDQDQLHALMKLNCRYGQGFYFSKPLKAGAMGALLAKGLGRVVEARRTATAPAKPCRLDAVVHQGMRSLDAIAPSLDNLHIATAMPLTARLAWSRSWARIYTDWEPLVVSVRSRGNAELAAAAMLARHTDAELTRVVSLGDGPISSTRFAARDRTAAEVLADGMASMLGDLTRPWRLELNQLSYDDPVAGLLAARFPGAELSDELPIPKVTLTDGTEVDDFLSKGMRRQLRKAYNRLETDGVPYALNFETETARIDVLLDELERIHVQRDHQARQESDLDDPVARELWREIIRVHNAAGQIEIGTLSLDGHLSAFVVSLLDRHAYRVFDGHFDTTYARYSPGRIVESAALARALADRRFRELDWMSGHGAEKILASDTAQRRSRLVIASSVAALDADQSGHELVRTL